MPSPEDCIQHALEIAKNGAFDGAHHKMWVIDQMIRALTDCPIVTVSAVDCNDKPYAYEAQGDSDAYLKWIADFCNGEDGPETYAWDVGIPP